jgi:cytokinin dehydrogenase
MAAARGAWQASDIQALSAEGLALSVDAPIRAAASSDFGGIVRGQSLAVFTPRTPEEVARAVLFARERGLSFTARGNGRSSGGQSVARTAVTLQLSRLDRIQAVDATACTVTCESGARWRSVLAATQAYGLMPQVLPLNLDLTVGGTLSVGGFGSNSHAFGFAASSVESMQAVSGAGAMLSSIHQPELLSATLGGLGRCAVMTSITLRLRRAPARVKTFYLLYDDVEPWLADMRNFRDRFQHMDGFCSASVQGMRNTPIGRRPFAKWFYGLHVSVEHDGAPPSANEALAGLKQRWVVHEEDNDQASFAARADPRFEMMMQTGAFSQPHPWLECLLPMAALPELLPRVLEALPLALADGLRLAPLVTAQHPPLIAVPGTPENAMVAVLPIAVQPPSLPSTLEALRAVNELLLSAGGKRYLAGWLEMNEDGWKRHYGGAYDTWILAKQRLDPDGVFGSMLT